MLTPEEKIEGAKQALENAKIWVDIAATIMTGGGSSRDVYDLMHKVGEMREAEQALLSKYIGDIGD